MPIPTGRKGGEKLIWWWYTFGCCSIVILFPTILTESCISSTTLCWIQHFSYISSVGLALAGNVPCVVGCCYQWMRVSSLVNALVCGVLSCCRCLMCFRSSSLCPPLGIELHVGTIIHTVPTASNYNTKVRFPNCIVQRVFSLARAKTVHFFLQRIIARDKHGHDTNNNFQTMQWGHLRVVRGSCCSSCFNSKANA
jgi:hypothetical protein